MFSARRLFSILLAAFVLAACSSAPATETSNINIDTPAPAASTATATVPSVNETAVVRSAQLSELKNDVQAMRQAGEIFNKAQEGDVVVLGGRVSTGSESKVRLDLTEGTIVRLGPDTEFTVEELTQTAADPFTRLKLLTGQLWVILNGGSLEVETPVGVATVRGSYLGVKFDPETQRLEVTCLEGQCGLSNDAGGVQLTNGQSSEIVGDDAPAPIEVLTYEEIQEWLEENPEAETIVEEVYPEGTPTPDPETESGDLPGGATGNLQYMLTNFCQSAVTITYTGQESGSFTLAPSETRSGELPPGEYVFSDGQLEVVWNSTNGPLTSGPCSPSGPPNGGGGSFQYTIGNQCQESVTVSYTGPESGSFTVAPGETKSGELPPGEYSLTNSRDNDPLVWNSSNGPLTGNFCDDGGSAGGGGGQPPVTSTEPLRYSLNHNCPADPQTGVVREGVWEWTFENLTTGQTYNLSVNPGESISGELPPGHYRVSDRDATGPLLSGEIDSGGPGINVSRCGGG